MAMKTPANRGSSRGYSLTELMITVAILGMTSMVVSQLLVSTFKLWKMNQTRLEVQRDARTALTLLESSLREASADTVVLTRNATGEPPYSKIGYTSVDGEAISFYQSAGQLIMQRAGRVKALTKDLRYVTFAYPDSSKDNLVSVALCLEKTAFGATKKDFYLSVQRIKVGNQ